MNILVPIMPKSFEEAMALELSHYEGTTLIEWRADMLPPEEILTVAPVIFERFSGYEIIFSLGHQKKDSQQWLPDEVYVDLIKQVQELYQPDYIEVPYKERQAIFDQLLTFSNLILSHYDTEKVPDNIMEIYSELTALSPRVVKLVLTPQTEQDVLDMMNYTRGFKSLHPDQTYMTIASGKLGQVTRFFGDLFGSDWTIATVGEESSSQLILSDMKQILSLLEKTSG
ncbi:type I 3-dehydroquinate dehydratase [Streptococcus sp. E24BD]|uniref:type I 3-dehydroquinate dehydratase n=1 Tax=Streptococcus sp. E24BD TaxID=3278715 RepID=UPI00359D4003